MRKVAPCAHGIHQDDSCTLLSYRLADTEDVVAWKELLADFKSQDLLYKALKLITVDGNLALLKALRDNCPFITVQRCIAHKLRNLSVKLKRVHQKTCMTEAKAIFASQSRREVVKRFKDWKARWIVEEERAVRCLEKDLHHYLHYFRHPKDRRKQVRTTNILERAFRELRKRTRPMGIFPNGEAVVRDVLIGTPHAVEACRVDE